VTCREFADFMADYLTGELSETIRSAFDHHLALCPNCQRYLTGYRETVTLGKAAFADDDATVPPQVPQELVQAILNARKAG
jgi:anti-sigma factor RsiW